MPRISLKTLKDNPPKLSKAERTRFEAMTDEEIDRNAVADPDASEWTDEQADRGDAARVVRKTRQRTGLSQSKFAEIFRIDVASLRDWEQGRYTPNATVLAYMKVIAHDPEAVTRALQAA